MALIVFGTKIKTNFAGFYGPEQQCPNCHRVYKNSYVKRTAWFSLYYVPLFPVSTKYFRMCPICCTGMELPKKVAIQEMQYFNGPTNQNFQIYAKHFLANKPTGFMAVDTSYFLYVKDLNTNEEICVAANVAKPYIKNQESIRGLQSIPIYDIK